MTLPPRKIIIDDNESRHNNAAALEKLLADIESSAAGTVRDAGTKFETLIRDWLVNEPTYKDRFSSVQTWKDWANSHPEKTTNLKTVESTLSQIRRRRARGTSGLWPSSP